MIKDDDLEPDFIINGEHFGRGNYYFNKHTKEKIIFETIKVKRWRIVEQNLQLIPEEEFNMFYDTHSYIVQWDYKKIIQNSCVSEDGSLFFNWKGWNAPKGYSPLPEEIDQKDVPVERVVQWSEPTIFLRLFNGQMCVKKCDSKEPKLFMVRGELDEETHFFQVPCEFRSLRSKSSFIFVSEPDKLVCLWIGRLACRENRIAGRKFLKNFENYEVLKRSESCEDLTSKFSITGSKNDYFLNVSDEDFFLELFYLTSVTGEITVTKVENPLRSQFFTAFPFLQTHLYSAPQPAVFFLNDHTKIWIWKGLAPENVDNEKFNSEFAAVKQYTNKYIDEYFQKYNKKLPVEIVHAGSEPLEFTNFFPFWEKN